MPSAPIPRPAPAEHDPYYGTYIGKVPDGDLLETLVRDGREATALLRGIPEAKALTRYAPGKWSIKEVVGHVCDTERIFCYRALRFGRGDPTPIEGFDQDAYVPGGRFDAHPLADLATELEEVRGATVALFRGMDADALALRGVANNKQVSVRALAWILAGHARHHVAILRDRYLK